MTRSLRPRSLRGKLVAAMLATTFVSLLSLATAVVVYDASDYRRSWIDDLVAQADIIANASATALVFDDRDAARETLALLRVRPVILDGALYAANGTLFAAYRAAPGDARALPAAPLPSGPRIDGDEIELFQPIREKGRDVGVLYLRARYGLQARVTRTLSIVVGVMAASLLLALLLAWRLQATVTRPILALTDAARHVVRSRDRSIRVAPGGDDEVGVLVAAFNDMLDEVARSTEALRQADRRKDEFLATLAHELRNPLSPLRLGLEIVGNPAADAQATARARDMMRRQLRQMVRLVDDLLDVSRITTGKLAIEPKPVALPEVLASAVEIARGEIDAHGHALAVAPVPDVTIVGDAVRLAQVVSNLLNNAARYTDPGGHVALRAAVDGDTVVIEVEDDGRGIPPELHDRLFEMFEQGDVPSTRVKAGLGVGLALARRLIELHGGTIEAASAGVGRGSRFRVRLPIGGPVRADDGVELR